MARSTTNRNARGSSRDRAVRRRWLVDTFGDGVKVDCVHCGQPQTVDTVSPDRIIPGVEGGTYHRDNIRPSCLPCNVSTGGSLGAKRRKERRATQ